MTEAEWLACGDPGRMLKYLRDPSRNRKLRLFACACCYRFRHLVVKEAQEALELAERFAEGLASQDQRRQAREGTFHVGWISDPNTAHRRGPAKACVCDALARSPYDAAVGASFRSRHIGVLSKNDWADWESEVKQQDRFLAALLHDIFGNPFRLVTINLTWLTPYVVALAQAIYDERAFGRLPELADALAKVGCDNEDILNHCRSEGPHTKGCWVVDLVLGKQ